MSVARATGADKVSDARAALPIDRGVAVRAVVIAAFLAVAMFVLPLAGGDWTKTFTSVAIYAVVAAGLGILYGRVGMISLGQVALLELGVWIAARLAYATGAIPFPLLIVITGLITGVIGILVGLPAL